MNESNVVQGAENTQHYELVVVGAGIAGLNALYAAVQYLPPEARVLLVDQKSLAGGMWNVAYQYARLHQPHPMFTVGDMKWSWRRPAAYLASRDDVQAHLASAITPVKNKVRLSTRFQHTVTSCAEVESSGGSLVRITCHQNDSPSRCHTITADRAVYAPGLNYKVADSLPFSSENVASVVPQELEDALEMHPDAHVYVVGGGKSGMDTILASLAANQARKVTLIRGRGTNFFNRTKYIPNGLARWTSGTPLSRVFHDMAMHFDGENEDSLIAYFRTRYSTDQASGNEVFLYGIQSEEEHNQIAGGLAESIPGYLADVIDSKNGPVMQFRDGTSRSAEKDSIFVNCTGGFFRDAQMSKKLSFLSTNNSMLSIGTREAIHFLTGVSGFFATHLLYRNQIRGRGFYMLDHEALFRLNRNAWVGASVAQAYLNQTIAVQTLPMMLLDRCGLDLDRWYPLPRRLHALYKMRANASRDIDHCKRVLDRIGDRFDIHCAPL